MYLIDTGRVFVLWLGRAMSPQWCVEVSTQGRGRRGAARVNRTYVGEGACLVARDERLTATAAVSSTLAPVHTRRAPARPAAGVWHGPPVAAAGHQRRHGGAGPRHAHVRPGHHPAARAAGGPAAAPAGKGGGCKYQQPKPKQNQLKRAEHRQGGCGGRTGARPLGDVRMLMGSPPA